MQTFMYTEINIFALVVLFLIFLNVHHRADRYLIEQKLFLALLTSNALILILDSAMWILDGKIGFYVRGLYLLVTAFYYSLNPIICMIWSFYADYQIYDDRKHLRKLLIPLLIPVCINTLLSFFSIWCNFLFYIDSNNIYHRGDHFYIMAAICYFYLIRTLIFIIIRQKKIKKHNFIPIIVFAILPFLAGILQTMFYGISLVWVCVTISILIIFINIQHDELNSDYLTGLFNRRQLDYYLLQRLQSNTDKCLLAGIMIDLNSFKLINDRYGHNAGDQALKHTAKILKRTFRRNEFIARYGGDEFIIVMEIKDKVDLIKAVAKLKENVRQFNIQKLAPYTISLSIGYDFFDCRSGEPAGEFIERIDRLMYKDKLNK